MKGKGTEVLGDVSQTDKVVKILIFSFNTLVYTWCALFQQNPKLHKFPLQIPRLKNEKKKKKTLPHKLIVSSDDDVELLF